MRVKGLNFNIKPERFKDSRRLKICTPKGNRTFCSPMRISLQAKIFLLKNREHVTHASLSDTCG